MIAHRGNSRVRRSVRCPRCLWLALFSLIASIAGALPAGAVDFRLEARTKQPGWCGYWWPMSSASGFHLYDRTGRFTPLLKYAMWTGNSQPLEWETTYQRTEDADNDWWGHCNGWAAAALMEPNPIYGVRATHRSTGEQLFFNRGETAGLLAAAYMYAPAETFFGGRHDSGADYRSDLRALDLHRALLYYLAARGQGLVVNIADTDEVWSYPADGFVMRGVTDSRYRDYTHVTLTLSFRDDNVDPGFTGDQAFTKTYNYWVRGNNPQTIDGSLEAAWEGNSDRHHPQFIWKPAFARAYIPGTHAPNTLDVSLVHRLTVVASGQPDPGSERDER